MTGQPQKFFFAETYIYGVVFGAESTGDIRFPRCNLKFCDIRNQKLTFWGKRVILGRTQQLDLLPPTLTVATYRLVQMQVWVSPKNH